MIRRIGIILPLLLISLLSCEKDDICVEGDTPLMVLRFYDQQNPGEPKTVTDLRVIGIGRNATLNTFADRADLDSIALPLDPAASRSGFIMISNSAEENGVETGNLDTLYIDYQVREEFVSRACGFVARFENLSFELAGGADPWIQEVEILRDEVTDQTSAHVKIYH